MVGRRPRLFQGRTRAISLAPLEQDYTRHTGNTFDELKFPFFIISIKTTTLNNLSINLILVRVTSCHCHLNLNKATLSTS